MNTNPGDGNKVLSKEVQTKGIPPYKALYSIIIPTMPRVYRWGITGLYFLSVFYLIYLLLWQGNRIQSLFSLNELLVFGYVFFVGLILSLLKRDVSLNVLQDRFIIGGVFLGRKRFLMRDRSFSLLLSTDNSQISLEVQQGDKKIQKKLPAIHYDKFRNFCYTVSRLIDPRISEATINEEHGLTLKISPLPEIVTQGIKFTWYDILGRSQAVRFKISKIVMFGAIAIFGIIFMFVVPNFSQAIVNSSVNQVFVVLTLFGIAISLTVTISLSYLIGARQINKFLRYNSTYINYKGFFKSEFISLASISTVEILRDEKTTSIQINYRSFKGVFRVREFRIPNLQDPELDLFLLTLEGQDFQVDKSEGTVIHARGTSLI